MNTIPKLIALITFPGVMIHEWAHKKFCDWNKVTVYKVKYFQFWNMEAGFVLHEKPEKIGQEFWISVGPLVLNTSITIFLGYVLAHISPNIFKYITLSWLAFSSGLHAFPSNTDAGNVLEDSKELLVGHRLHLSYYLAYPFFGLIWIANKLKIFWFDVFYSLALIAVGFFLI